MRQVRAAGGVVWRQGAHKPKVLLVYRPRWDDWTFPKGKLTAGESWLGAAVREVQEETGFSVEVGPELPRTDYLDAKGRTKSVRYWAMTVVGGEFVPNREVTAIEWCGLRRARRRLTYERDLAVLDGFEAVTGASPASDALAD